MRGPLEVVTTPFGGQRQDGGEPFPRAITPRGPVSPGQAAEWVGENRQGLLRQLADGGAVLLRGFGATSAEDFDAVVTALGLANFPYERSLSNAVRVNRTPRVFSANEAPPDVRIFFHHEMAQTPLFPQWIFFFCEQAPASGGQTPLCRSDLLYDRLRARHETFVADCERLGLRYTNVMPGEDDPESGMGRSWRGTLGVDTARAAERRLGELGYRFRWLDDGCLEATTPALPAVMTLADGRRTFFNQLIAAFSGWKDRRNDPANAIRHGDGTPLDAAAVRDAAEIAEELAYDHAWQAGDIVLVDNRRVMHARRPYTGTRKVLASLAEMRSQRFDPSSDLAAENRA